MITKIRLLLFICLLSIFSVQAHQIEINKVNLDIRYQAFKFYESGDLITAKNLYSQCLVLDKDDISCLLGRGAINYLENNYIAALTDYERVIFLDKNNLWALSGITAIFSKTGIEVINLSSLEELAENLVSFSGLYQALGEWFLHENNPFKALFYFQNAIQLDATNPYLRSSLGLAYELNNQPHKALKEYETSLVLSKNKSEFPTELVAQKIEFLTKGQLNE